MLFHRQRLNLFPVELSVLRFVSLHHLLNFETAYTELIETGSDYSARLPLFRAASLLLVEPAPPHVGRQLLPTTPLTYFRHFQLDLARVLVQRCGGWQ
jgi:hypothetical protein